MRFIKLRTKLMKKISTIFLLLCLTTIGFSQTQAIRLFDNDAGDNDWNNAVNWDGDVALPTSDDEVRVTANNVTIINTGSTPTISNLTIGGAKTVTLDMDLNIDGNTHNNHGIIMFNNSFFTLANGRTITINANVTKEAVRLNSGKTNTFTVATGGTIDIQQGLNGLFIEDASHTLTNNGTINITGAINNGVNLVDGTLINAGVINITSNCPDGIEQTGGTLLNQFNGEIIIWNTTLYGINQSGGSFTNTGNVEIDNATSMTNGFRYRTGSITFINDGDFNINKTDNDNIVIEALGFENNNIIDLVVKDDNTQASVNCLYVGAGGKFTNNSDGRVSANGGADVGGVTIKGRAIFVEGGEIQNFGYIYTFAGEADQSFRVEGTVTNESCGFIYVGTGRMNVNDASGNTGNFVNNGLFKSDRSSGSGIFTQQVGITPVTATNNAFYKYAGNTNNFANGVATIIDNGVSIVNNKFTVDALSSCSVNDIGIDVAYDWYSDVANINQAGSNDVSGALTLDDQVWSGTAGAQSVYSCFGTEFRMEVSNVDGGCLPVELTSFTGVLEGGNTILKWETESELNNAGFEVQRSADGLSWDILGFVNGNGTTVETQTYNFVDENPLVKNYYRLKQMDFSGTYEYSNVIIVNANVKTPSANALVYPNPTSGTFNIEVENMETAAQVTIFNNFGQLMKTVQLTNQTTAISLEEFSNGTYYIQVLNGKNTTYQTIIKQ